MKKQITLIMMFFLMICSLATAQRLATEEARIILKRAQSIVSLIPDENTKNMISGGLSEMQIIEPDSKGGIQFKNGKFFIIVAKMDRPLGSIALKPGEDMFGFVQDQMINFGRIVIIMNQDISLYSQKIDDLGCALIHEMVHSIQINDLINTGKKIELTPELIFQHEIEAWANTAYLYTKIHPEVFQRKCDCGTLKIESLTGLDDFETNLILFAFCREKFLKTLY